MRLSERKSSNVLRLKFLVAVAAAVAASAVDESSGM